MKRKTQFNQRPFFFLFSGLIITAFAVLVFLLILKSVYGRYEAADLYPNFDGLKNLIFGTNPDIAILNSEYTRNMLPAKNKFQDENIEIWKNFLDNLGERYEVLSDLDIENGHHSRYDLLVLPGSLSLSDQEIIQIKKFLQDGGSIYATGGTASYSSSGKWRGWELFSEVFGIRFAHEIGSEEKTKIHTLRGGQPLTSNIPAGFPLRVATWDRPIAVEVLDPRTRQLSFWYNYRLDEGLVREGIKQSTGIVYGNYGQGRFVWMGFEINSILGIKDDYIFFERLFNNSINWLLHGPIAYIKDWPNGYDAAAVISTSLVGNTSNIENLITILENENVPATFFIEPFIAKQSRSTVQRLSEHGEVAAMVDIGYIAADNQQANYLYNYETQLANLNSGLADLKGIINKEISGVLPYFGVYDENTIKAAINSGYKYLITDSLSDRSVPKIIIRGEDRIMSMTKTARDDYEIIRDKKLTLPEFQFYSYQEDIDRVLFERGLFFLKVHTEYQCKPENVNVIRAVIRDLKRKKFWITTAEQIHEWYKNKEYIELRTQRRGDRRVAITITNPGPALVNNLVVDVDLNTKAKRITIDTEIIGTKSARFKHIDGSQYLFLYINDLEPGESRTYYVDYDRLNDKPII
jgi:peptidoglycan/xylan/chitin deacetylase (PgdA/CDA1 family)